jgi:hypothetical protein
VVLVSLATIGIDVDIKIFILSDDPETAYRAAIGLAHDEDLFAWGEQFLSG